MEFEECESCGKTIPKSEHETNRGLCHDCKQYCKVD